MIKHLLKNWIVYIMIGGFIWFIIYAYLSSHGDEKK